MESSDLDIDLHLKEIKHLFVDPELNPFEDQRLQISGIEEAANHLRIKERKVDKVRLNIFLPGRQIDPDLQSKTVGALSRYCDFKILQNQHQLEIERAAGWRAVMIGFIFSAVCLLMVSIAYLMGPLGETLQGVFVGFFTILIWMAIWNPAEAFLYGLPPYKREIKTYKALKNAEIVIKEET
jgi:uncharacterized oligopeptide transporter (OPT) family protein